MSKTILSVDKVIENMKKPFNERFGVVNRIKHSNQKGFVEEVQERADRYLAKRAAIKKMYIKKGQSYTLDFGTIVIRVYNKR